MKTPQRLAILLLTATAIRARAADPATEPTFNLAQIQQGLANEDFAKREATQHELSKLPPTLLWTIQQAAEAATDPEVKAQLESRTAQMAQQNLQARIQQPAPPAPKFTHHLQGRLLDADGKPISNAPLLARSAALGQDLWSSYELQAKSDEQGRFDIPIPFAGILYYISTEVDGFTSAYQTILANDKPLPDWSLTPAKPYIRILHGSLLDAAGNPVAHHPIEILGEYGRSFTATTDDQGAYTITLNGGYLGQGVARVHEGKQIVPLTLIRDPDIQRGNAPADILKLGLAASVKGTVRDATGPIPHATVRMAPQAASGFQLTAITDDNGTYQINDAPPGDYIVTADSPAHVRKPPRTFEFEIPTTALQPGKTATANLTLDSMAALAGQVLNAAGKPVANALIAVKTNWRDTSKGWSFTFTDPDGHFLVGTGRTTEPLNLYAFSPDGGLRSTPLGAIKFGESRLLKIQLPGTVKVAGLVTDSEGKPIANVLCFNAANDNLQQKTSPDGRFDLGLNTVSPDGHSTISFNPPRPRAPDTFNTGYFGPANWLDVENPDKAPQFYLPSSIKLPNPANMQVTLDKAQLLSISGTAFDAQNKPLPEAEVYLYAGNAADSWVEEVHPTILRDRFRNAQDYHLLFGVLTDKNGHYEFFLLNRDPANFSLGLYTKEKTSLVKDLQIPKDKSTLEVPLHLPAE